MNARAWIRFYVWQLIFVGFAALGWIVFNDSPRYEATIGVSISATLLAVTFLNVRELVTHLRGRRDIKAGLGRAYEPNGGKR